MSDLDEGVAPPVEQPVVEAPPTAGEAVDVKPEEKNEKEVKLVEEKKPSEKKEKKPRQHKAAAHPPYFQMIKEAITALNEKSGSSPYAIAKHIEANHKSVLPANFRKILSLQLKNSTARGKLIKVKASYKLAEAVKRDKVATAKSVTTKAARANAGKPQETATKRRRTARFKSVNQIEAAAKKKTTAGGRRARKSAPTTKPKQPKSIRSSGKKAKKATAV